MQINGGHLTNFDQQKPKILEKSGQRISYLLLSLNSLEYLYNNEHRINTSLDSLLSQTHLRKRWEILSTQLHLTLLPRLIASLLILMTFLPIFIPVLTAILLLRIHRSPDKHRVVRHHLLNALLNILLIGILLHQLRLHLVMMFLIIAVVGSLFSVYAYGLLQAKVGIFLDESVLILLVVRFKALDEFGCSCMTLKLKQETVFLLLIVAFHLKK